ncbi:hypothetical protein M409DRAFT_25626 [Zasmidium cellare ATCC 36951]|uniref:Uncharacterized protein n=1 Tax=Zasmidium cellare ATCC 36951 TaxID=1080233 RepID=A0A6A6C9X8_ZASCE|nr:uncharacterized protein M409DRAFT_25626 [Zasmidium cellare ATCC 36951]KAF2163851.1 hypothetical protein M409DRAFT_25626 [Zasmidium cellare ATCC 36951]
MNEIPPKVPGYLEINHELMNESDRIEKDIADLEKRIKRRKTKLRGIRRRIRENEGSMCWPSRCAKALAVRHSAADAARERAYCDEVKNRAFTETAPVKAGQQCQQRLRALCDQVAAGIPCDAGARGLDGKTGPEFKIEGDATLDASISKGAGCSYTEDFNTSASGISLSPMGQLGRWANEGDTKLSSQQAAGDVHSSPSSKLRRGASGAQSDRQKATSR